LPPPQKHAAYGNRFGDAANRRLRAAAGQQSRERSRSTYIRRALQTGHAARCQKPLTRLRGEERRSVSAADLSVRSIYRSCSPSENSMRSRSATLLSATSCEALLTHRTASRPEFSNHRLACPRPARTAMWKSRLRLRFVKAAAGLFFVCAHQRAARTILTPLLWRSGPGQRVLVVVVNRREHVTRDFER